MAYSITIFKKIPSFSGCSILLQVSSVPALPSSRCLGNQHDLSAWRKSSFGKRKKKSFSSDELNVGWVSRSRCCSQAGKPCLEWSILDEGPGGVGWRGDCRGGETMVANSIASSWRPLYSFAQNFYLRVLWLFLVHDFLSRPQTCSCAKSRCSRLALAIYASTGLTRCVHVGEGWKMV